MPMHWALCSALFASADSLFVAGGRDRTPGTALNRSPVLASSFAYGSERAYARADGTPPWETLEELVSALEGGRAVAFASGIAGVAVVFDQLAVGYCVVLPDDCYQGVVSLAESLRQRGIWQVERLASRTRGHG